MSRIGKSPIKCPEDLTLSFEDRVLTIKGPKGTLKREVHPDIDLKFSEGVINVSVVRETDNSSALWGLYRSLINNMVCGVVNGYSKSLEINGTGYKASVQGNFLVLSLGYSHDIYVEIDEGKEDEEGGLNVSVKKNTITVSGISKQKVGQFAANVRSLRKPEPYKGKGVKYVDEVIRRKEGKNK